METQLGWPVFAFAGLFAFLLLLTSNHPAYGYFVDELGYLACAKRLAFGYVDHPPLAPMVLAINRSLLGDSLPAMRLLPALCGAGTVLSAAWMAQRLGAARFAQLLAALCVSVAPVYLGVFSIFSTNCFEVLLWSLTLAVLLELSRSEDARLWWRVGLLLGLAVSSKHTSVALVAAIVLALPLSPLRRHLLDRQLWFGAALALIVVLPNLAWQIEHDWASLEFYRNVDREANVSTSVLEVLDEQVGSFNPATFPVWASGLFFLLFAARGRAYRLVGCSVVPAAATAWAGVRICRSPSRGSRNSRWSGSGPSFATTATHRASSICSRRANRQKRVKKLSARVRKVVAGLRKLTNPPRLARPRAETPMLACRATMLLGFPMLLPDEFVCLRPEAPRSSRGRRLEARGRAKRDRSNRRRLPRFA